MTSVNDILFLYNHDASHQVAHSIGLARALGASNVADNEAAAKTIIATGSATIRAEVAKHLPETIASNISWIDLSLPKWVSRLLSPINRIAPVERLARLYWHRRTLAKAAIIVSTERTCLTLKRHWRRFGGTIIPRFVYIPHGSGDRNVAVHPALRDFDLCLVSGQKVVDQLSEAGVARAENCRIIGYAKFDILRGRTPERFFPNDRPTFLYNPHFDPHMSSWFDHGPAILDYFCARAEQFNLIFAPHVMLFYKTLHISPEYKVSRRRPDVDAKYYSAPNIRIDLDSPRLFDMSYTLSADAYIGDVSSQVYEFLYRPRACFFVDTHSHTSPAGSPAYDFWNNGPVVQSASELTRLLPDFAAFATKYEAAQVARMAYTADSSDPRPASERGAAALRAYLADIKRSQDRHAAV